MSRISGWYKRHTQAIILVMAFLISALYNVDTFAISRALYRDTPLRESVASDAAEFVTKAESGTSGATDGDQPVETKEEESGETTEAGQSGEETKPTVGELREQLEELALPLGWSSKQQSENKTGLDDGRSFPPNDLKAGLVKLSGILFTTIAVSLGAPFWFDLLGKLVNMRSTGKSPDQEASKATPTK